MYAPVFSQVYQTLIFFFFNFPWKKNSLQTPGISFHQQYKFRKSRKAAN